MSTLVNARGNKSCYSDVECIPGGLHPLDALEHLSRLSHEQLADVETVRLSKDKLGPAMPFARLRKTVTEATAVYGPAWWATRTWADMGTSDRGHPLSPRGAHKDGPRESARYAYRGTIVVEASHPGPAARSIDPRCGTAPACRRSGLTESCEDGPRFPGGGTCLRPARWASQGVDTGAPGGQHKIGPRESARYGYKGTIVGEASHPGPTPPAADLAGAPAPREVLRYMRPTAGAGPGTSRGGGHRQNRGGRAAGAGRRGGWSVGPRAAGSMATDAAVPLGESADEAGSVLPRPGDATPPDPDAGFPPVYAHAADGGASGLGVVAGPPGPDDELRENFGGCMESTDGADGLSSAASDGGVDVGEFARAQDEPLLADRRRDSPCPMEAEADETTPGRPDGSGDESMPTAEPLTTPPDQPGDVPMPDGDGDGGAC